MGVWCTGFCPAATGAARTCASATLDVDVAALCGAVIMKSICGASPPAWACKAATYQAERLGAIV